MRVNVWLIPLMLLVLGRGEPSHDPSGTVMLSRTDCTTLLPSVVAPVQARRAAKSAFERLISRTPGEFEAALHDCGPHPVSDDAKALIIASLPEQGRVTHFNAGTRQKLASLPEVLRVHDRDLQYAVMVIDIPQAAIVLHARTVLLISNPAVAPLRGEELAATNRSRDRP